MARMDAGDLAHRLGRQPGANAEGYAGLEDGVDFHWGEMFKAAALSTLLSVGAEAGTSQNESSLVQALRSGASNSISQTGQQIVSRQLGIAPTLTIRPGLAAIKDHGQSNQYA